MFTGLIEAVGQVTAVDEAGTGRRLRIATPFAAQLADGESVAVNGVCLTVTRARDHELSADIGPETARVTTLGSIRSGDPVNLERAMRADQRFGGHFVQGHVDGMGTVAELRTDGDARWVTVAFPAALGPYFVHRGSVAVDGISLTVASLDGDRFAVMIVPFTWTHTNLPSLRVGSRVNLECDMVGKYVARAVELFKST
jgi:riboflavin synthase alpha subunit